MRAHVRIIIATAAAAVGLTMASAPAQAKEDYWPSGGGFAPAGNDYWPSTGGFAPPKDDYYPSTGG
ncbi:hypothetical protein [Actinomadura harenae]|uniref:hypothetical protein n=1 Tax=Actinomadura harenae TaxID=2483351 RepID=UPI0018F6C59A|nr:hypothetical protein [Actinomadura harenae]